MKYVPVQMHEKLIDALIEGAYRAAMSRQEAKT